MFYLIEKDDLAIAQIPRAGLNTISEWLGRGRIIVKNDDPKLFEISRRVAFIRHPFERLKSAFSLFYWLKKNGGHHHISGAPTDNWQKFVDHVLNPDIPDDEHWRPQSVHIGNVPNIYHRFENLIDKFEIYRPGILPHNMKTSRRPTTEYKTYELSAKYADDLKLWQEADN